MASITIVSRNRALGYIRRASQDDRYLYTRDQLLGAIQVCVAGAVMEEIIFGQRSTGAANDIEQAVQLAKRMVFSGLSPLGIVSSDLAPGVLNDTVAQIIREQEDRVKEVLACRVDEVGKIAAHLLQEESLGGDEFRLMLGGRQVS